MPERPKTSLQWAVGRYRTLRRRGTPPTETLQQLHTELLIAAADLADRGDLWAEISIQSLAVSADQHLSLIALRVGLDTAYQRFWMTGRLSQADDHLLFLEHINGNRYWNTLCRTLGCAIKHGVAYFEFPEWSGFTVERPDGEVLLHVTDRSTTIEQAYRMLEGN